MIDIFKTKKEIYLLGIFDFISLFLDSCSGLL